MNVCRLNMSHGTHESHGAVVAFVDDYNASGRGHVATMLDTKGPEVRSGDLAEPIDMRPGEEYVFTTEEGANGAGGRISVNYDAFVDDVAVGDTLMVDGGILTLRVAAVEGRDVRVRVAAAAAFRDCRAGCAVSYCVCVCLFPCAFA